MTFHLLRYIGNALCYVALPQSQVRYFRPTSRGTLIRDASGNEFEVTANWLRFVKT